MKMRFMRLIATFMTALAFLPACERASKELVSTTYTNPVIAHNCADPTILDDRERTGWFYAYSTQVGKNVVPKGANLPIYRSKDMVNWEYVRDGFTERPSWEPKGRVWAPDINYVDGHYVLYYSMGVWGDLIRSASGVAVSDSPTGPFEDKGMIVSYANTGVKNSIDANLVVDNGKKYLFWGSLGEGSGIWGIELSDDGLSVKPGAKATLIGADNIEGTYIIKRDGYYYCFNSKGSCCEGVKSTYHVIVSRSSSILGPYVSPDGQPLTDRSYKHTILKSSEDLLFVGPGHDSQIITDDAGQDWMAYHAFHKANNYDGRCMLLDKIIWENGWPRFESVYPSEGGDGPKWKKASE